MPPVLHWSLVVLLILVVVVCRYISLAFENGTKEVHMKTTRNNAIRRTNSAPTLKGSVMSTVWAIGTSVAAGGLVA